MVHSGGYWNDWFYTLSIWWDHWPGTVLLMAFVPVVVSGLGWVIYSWGWRDWKAARTGKVKGFDVLPKR